MTPLRYTRANDAAQAVQLGTDGGAAYLGGGTNLVDLLRETVVRSERLVDVSGLSDQIEETESGGLMIGAAVRNTALAEHSIVRTRYPLLSRAILAGASAQIRNMATVGGNLLQRTRCAYFYDTEGSRCNKRAVGTGCDARDGFNRIHAVLGASDECVATHPSDMCVALAALNPVVHVTGAHGPRSLPFGELHRLPGDRPDLDTTLEAGDLITAIELAPLPAGARSAYRKVRDRASYAFALVSVAAVLELDGERVNDVRIAFGGVAHKPWRATKAEAALRGGPATMEAFHAAAALEFAEACPLRDNAFKPALATRTLAAVLGDLTRGDHA